MLRETKVENGRVKGVACGWPSITAYYGIPYAAPPVGPLRWHEPMPAADWQGVRDCARPSARCPQLGVQPGGFYEREFYPVAEPMSEDCLYLNVWTPAQSAQEKLPVIFWVHGGAFMTGYGHSAHFDGEHFARQGVILVTINYRLNVFGWMVDPELSAESEHGVSGNYGLLDQIFALKWVRRNISNFGGDPERITLAGQSAGAACVQALCSSPLCRGDFAGAIFQSGGGIDALPDMDYPLLAEVEEKMNITESLGVQNIAQARELPAEELLARWLKTMPTTKIWRTPVIDGYVLPKKSAQIVYDDETAHVPYLIGFTAKEGIVTTPTPESFVQWAKQAFGEQAEEFLKIAAPTPENFDEIKNSLFTQCLQAGTAAWALTLEKQGRGPVYVYELTRDLPGDDKGPFHAADLWYVFKTFMRAWRPWTGRDFELARDMNTYWANFAKNLNPNGKGLPQWTPYTAQKPEVMVFGNEKTEMQRLPEDACTAFRRQYLLNP